MQIRPLSAWRSEASAPTNALATVALKEASFDSPAHAGGSGRRLLKPARNAFWRADWQAERRAEGGWIRVREKNSRRGARRRGFPLA